MTIPESLLQAATLTKAEILGAMGLANSAVDIKLAENLGIFRHDVALAARDKALRAVAAWLRSRDVVLDFCASAPDDWSPPEFARAIAAEIESIVGGKK